MASRFRHTARLARAAAAHGWRSLRGRSPEDDAAFGRALLAELDTMEGLVQLGAEGDFAGIVDRALQTTSVPLAE